MEIPGLRGLPPNTVVKSVVQEFFRDDMSTYAAAFAFHMLFALFPFLLFLIALLNFLNLSQLFDWLLQQAEIAVPSQAMEQVRTILEEIQEEQQTGLLSIGIIAAVWIASTGVRATMNALNAAYDVSESRPVWQRYLLSLVYTLGLAGLAIVATGLMVIGPQVVTWLAEQFGIGDVVLALWAWLRVPVAMLLTMLAVTLIYYVAPNVEQKFRLITPGSVLAVLLWLIASLGFRYYVANFSRYNLVYGSITAVIVLLTYLFLCAVLLLLGGTLNAVIQRQVPVAGDPIPRDQEQTPRTEDV